MACSYAKYTGNLGVCLATMIKAAVNPFEPPYPGKITAEQATHLAESLARGEPNREKIALTVLSDKVKVLI